MQRADVGNLCRSSWADLHEQHDCSGSKAR
jgi:hypothetical protein